MSRAAGAVCGMVELDPIISQNDKPVIAISMFGNSTPCVEKCSKILNEKGFATVIFHATGSGGKAMEDFIVEGNCIAWILQPQNGLMKFVEESYQLAAQD